jgi:DNA-binding YbaB/EbfC family protein
MNFDQIKQARELKAKMDKIQKELDKTLVEGEGGKGMVKITMTGKMEVKAVKIDPSVIDPKNEKKLEEMVLKAIDDAVEKSQKEAEKQLKELYGGLKIPGLF